MSCCCIGTGKCFYFYIYILGSIIFNTLKDISLEYSEVVKKKFLLQSIYKYFAIFIVGYAIFRKIKRNLNKRKINII